MEGCCAGSYPCPNITVAHTLPSWVLLQGAQTAADWKQSTQILWARLENLVPDFLVPWVPLCADPVSWSYRPLGGGPGQRPALAWPGLRAVLEPIALYDICWEDSRGFCIFLCLPGLSSGKALPGGVRQFLWRKRAQQSGRVLCLPPAQLGWHFGWVLSAFSLSNSSLSNLKWPLSLFLCGTGNSGRSVRKAVGNRQAAPAWEVQLFDVGSLHPLTPQCCLLFVFGFLFCCWWGFLFFCFF